MRLPKGFVKLSKGRLTRCVRRDSERLVRFATLRRGRLTRLVIASRDRVAHYVNRDKVRFTRTVVIALVLLLGGGTAGALALLPPELTGGAAQRLGLASGGAAPSAIADGDLDERRTEPHRAGANYYRETTTRRVNASVKAGFLPIYREAAATFNVSWRLLASIHRQETAFSSVPSTYHGLNAFGCCAGPMQFNVTNGPPSTWARYRQSFGRGDRPRRYPHPTRHHPSIYDDFDAIMAAGALLRDSGAGQALDIGSWAAAYAYYGRDTFGTHYASQVLARAAGWERYGFCVNCPDDPALIAEFDDAYGEEARRQLGAAEGKDKKKRKRKKLTREEAEQRREDRGEVPPASIPEETKTPEPAKPTTTPEPSTTTPPTTTETTPAPAPPPPDAKTCTKLERLLGCRDG